MAVFNHTEIIRVARLCHEVNRAYCEALGDHSQQAWEIAEDWQRDSAIQGVMFHLEHPDATPAASHDSWLKVKVDGGWTWGATKDPVAKTHPCILPFEELPREQQAKDHIFRAIVRTSVATGALSREAPPRTGRGGSDETIVGGQAVVPHTHITP